MSVKVEIINIGDEIVSGEILNTNGFTLAQSLSSAGYEVIAITTIGDDKSLIKVSLNTALRRADFLIVTGGLGPTIDDRTNEAVADALNLPLIPNPDVLEYMKAYLKERRLKPEYEKMVLIPKGAEPIGLEFRACGFKLIYENKYLYFLPGVPDQMTKILRHQVMPELSNTFPGVSSKITTTLNAFGLDEVQIASRMRDILRSFPNVKILSLPQFPEIRLLLSSRDSNELDIVKKKIKERLGLYIFGEGDETLPVVVGRLLRLRGLKIATAESITGGLISDLITNVPGSSEYFERGVVAYSNRAKTEILNVPQRAIDEEGAVSEVVARYMAEGIKRIAKTDLGIAVTGYAGPTAGPEARVGTVYIGLSAPQGTKVKMYFFEESRERIKLLTATNALDWIRRYCLDDTFIYSN